jgi:hypothetical protein
VLGHVEAERVARRRRRAAQPAIVIDPLGTTTGAGCPSPAGRKAIVTWLLAGVGSNPFRWGTETLLRGRDEVARRLDRDGRREHGSGPEQDGASAHARAS